MLDVGWSELLVIAVVLIVVVGPKDLPPMLRAFGKMTARMRSMAGEFRQQFDEALKEAELDDVRKTIGDAQRLNPVNSLREAMNPLRQTANEIRSDLRGAVSAPVVQPQTGSIAAETPAMVEPPVTTAPAISEPAVPAPALPADRPPPAPVFPWNAVGRKQDASRKDGA